MKIISSIETRLVSRSFLPSIFEMNDVEIERSTIFISFVNPVALLALTNEKSLFEVDYFFSDGFFYTRIFNLFNGTSIERASFDFSSIADDVFNYAVTQKLKVVIIGGSESDINASVNNIKRRHPDLIISDYRSGYFNEGELLNYVKRLEADLIVLGMGAPLQERAGSLIKEYHPSNKLIFTCGGFLTQTAMSEDYYPKIIKKTGLRWMYRCLKEKHVLKRLVTKYPEFIFKYLKYKIKRASK